jgi:hypothetical protein
VVWTVRRGRETTGATVDHLVALTVFLAALVLFIGLFNQTIQVAILYQSHRYIAAKCTDLLDNILLNPGYPTYWGQSDGSPTSFGLQDPEFTQYALSPFSLMRLSSLTGQPVFYPKTGLTYSNITEGFGDLLMMPFTEAINYSTASTLLGTNGSYGFQLTIAPVVTVSISEFQSSNPLILSVNVTGQGFPLSNAMLSYCFLTVSLSGGGPYPAYATQYGSAYTDEQGLAFLEFDGVIDDSVPYALIAYTHLGGLIGMGYDQRVTSDQQYIIPFIADLNGTVLLAHSYDVHYVSSPPAAELTYNATFVLLAEDFTLRQLPLGGITGKVDYGNGPFPYGVITIPTTNPGILVVTYEENATEGGIILMPWGISSLAFTTTFGADMLGKEWVATDIRQVVVDNIAYQAKLALWSLQGYRVTS